MTESERRQVNVPEDHRAFIEAFGRLAASYPAAAERFALLDLGASPADNRRVRDEHCSTFLGVTVCEIRPMLQ